MKSRYAGVVAAAVVAADAWLEAARRGEAALEDFRLDPGIMKEVSEGEATYKNKNYI